MTCTFVSLHTACLLCDLLLQTDIVVAVLTCCRFDRVGIWNIQQKFEWRVHMQISAGIATLSVRPCVCRIPILCQNG